MKSKLRKIVAAVGIAASLSAVATEALAGYWVNPCAPYGSCWTYVPTCNYWGCW